MFTAVDYDPTGPERFEALRTEYSRALSAAGVSVLGMARGQYGELGISQG